MHWMLHPIFLFAAYIFTSWVAITRGWGGGGGGGGETMIGRERGNQGLQDCQYVYTCMSVDAGESDG